MNTNPKPILNCCNFIAWTSNELNSLDGYNNGSLYFIIDEFNKDSTNSIIPMHGWIVWNLQAHKQFKQKLIFQHWTTMCKNMERGLQMNHLMICFTYKTMHWFQNSFRGMLVIQLHILQVCIIFNNVVSFALKFYTPNVFLRYPTCNPQFILVFNKKINLCITQCG